MIHKVLENQAMGHVQVVEWFKVLHRGMDVS